MNDANDRLDPLLQRLVDTLRLPVDLSPDLDAQIMARIRGRQSAGGALRRILAGAGLALAAGLGAFLLARDDRASDQLAQPVQFSIQAGEASSVAVVGDFNEWDPSGTPLTRSRSGEWSVTLSLPPGRYRFSFLVDGRTWVADPERQPMPDPDFDVPTSLVLVEGSTL